MRGGFWRLKFSPQGESMIRKFEKKLEDLYHSLEVESICQLDEFKALIKCLLTEEELFILTYQSTEKNLNKFSPLFY